MNIFFKSNKRKFPFGTVFHTDMHSHFLPGIDDGAKSLEESLELIDGLIGLGYKRLIATPHVMSALYQNTTESIRQSLREFQGVLKERGYSIAVDAAAEYMLDENFEQVLETQELLTFGNQYLLVESYFQSLPVNFQELLFKMQLKGYKVVLAHPERYHFVKEDLVWLEEMKANGVHLQANALSLVGYYGKREKKIAERMLDGGLIDFVGSDVHHAKHLYALGESLVSDGVYKKLERLQNKMDF